MIGCVLAGPDEVELSGAENRSGRQRAPLPWRSVAAVALLAAVVALSLLARWPSLGVLPPGEDKALNARYFAALRAGEELPLRDPQMLAPDGRVVAEQFPLGMYRLMERWTAWVPATDVEQDRLRFGALQGLLFVAALLWLGFETGGSLRAAIWTGLLALAIPALNLRTSAAWLRWEVLGAAGLAVYGAASARCLRVGSWSAAALAALALPLAAWMWRPSLTLAAVALGFGLLRLAWGRLDDVGERWLAATALGSIAACVLPAWARHHGVLWGPIGIAALATLAAVSSRRIPRLAAAPGAGAALAGGVVLVVAATATLGTGVYSDLGPLLVGQVRGLLLGSVPRNAVGRLYATVMEFQPLTARFAGQPLHELARDQFGLLVVVSGIVAALAIRRAEGAQTAAASDARALIGWIALVYAGLTLLFERSVVVAAPFVAAWAGSCVALAAARTQGLRRVVTLGMAAAVCVHGLAVLPGFRQEVGKPGPILPPGIGAAVASTTPATAVVASSWGIGYELQLFAERATLCDGLLEDPENRRRIVEVWARGAIESPQAWADRLRVEGVTHVLVGPELDVALSLLYLGHASAPGADFSSRDRTVHLAPHAPGASAMVQMVGGREVGGFERLWSRQSGDGTRWSLYALAGLAEANGSLSR